MQRKTLNRVASRLRKSPLLKSQCRKRPIFFFVFCFIGGVKKRCWSAKECFESMSDKSKNDNRDGKSNSSRQFFSFCRMFFSETELKEKKSVQCWAWIKIWLKPTDILENYMVGMKARAHIWDQSAFYTSPISVNPKPNILTTYNGLIH